jgi:hypothetical protein
LSAGAEASSNATGSSPSGWCSTDARSSVPAKKRKLRRPSVRSFSSKVKVKAPSSVIKELAIGASRSDNDQASINSPPTASPDRALTDPDS